MCEKKDMTQNYREYKMSVNCSISRGGCSIVILIMRAYLFIYYLGGKNKLIFKNLIGSQNRELKKNRYFVLGLTGHIEDTLKLRNIWEILERYREVKE